MTKDDYLIREREVCRRMQFGQATLAYLVKQKQFPPPVRTRPNKAWKSSTIDRHIATLADQDITRLQR